MAASINSTRGYQPQTLETNNLKTNPFFKENKFFEAINYLGTLFIHPFSDIHADFSNYKFSFFRDFSRQHPLENGIEKTLKCASHFFNISLSVIGMGLTSSLALLGIGLKQCNRFVFQRNLSFWVGNLSPLKNQPKKVKIVHWNICGLNGGLPTEFGGIPSEENRHKKIVSKILEMDPDVLCLSEVGSLASQSLYASLKDNYSYFFTDMRQHFGKHGAGLFVATKLPLISKPHYIPFKAKSNGIQKLQERGFFVFEMKNQYLIYTQFDPKNKKVRQKQLEEVKKMMDQKKSNEKPYIFIGDLHINGIDCKNEKGSDHNNEKYQEMLSSGFQDLCPNNLKKEQTTTNLFDLQIRGKKEEDVSIKRVDHVLTYGKELSNAAKVSFDTAYHLDREGALSNHHPVIVTFG